MKIENINPVGLEWHEVVGNVKICVNGVSYRKTVLGSIDFENRTQRQDAMAFLTRKYRPYRFPLSRYWVVTLKDDVTETNNYYFNPKIDCL